VIGLLFLSFQKLPVTCVYSKNVNALVILKSYYGYWELFFTENKSYIEFKSRTLDFEP